jgi:hypothetical protein
LRRAGTETITIRHGVGNIRTPDENDFLLDSEDKAVALLYNGTNWLLVGAGGVGHERGHYIANTLDHIDWPVGLTATELSYLDGVTGPIQDQLDAKETPSGAQAKVDAHAVLTTGVHGVGTGTIAKVEDIAVDTNLSAGAQEAVALRHARGHAVASVLDHTDWPTGLTATELGYVAGVTGPIQTQLDSKETPAGAQAKVDAHATITDAHGATSAATANRIILRDTAGRAKVAAPVATDDIAQKAQVDAVQTNLDAHIAATAAHSATSAATANRIVLRDAAGRAQFADGAAAADVATKGQLDTAIATRVAKSGDTMAGILVAQNNTAYTTAQVRNIIISTGTPTGGGNGDIWLRYTP